MRACVIIPAYNESLKIAYLIEEIKKQGLEAVVVDDGSRDNTAGIAEAHGAVVLRNDINQGKGASLKRGFEYALKENFAAAIAMDGDGQHLPQELAHFIGVAEKSPAAVLVGNRMRNSRSMPLDRLLTNKFMSWLISAVIGQHIPDTQCGYRLIKRVVLERLSLKTSKYEIETEILIQAARMGFKIESLPIKTVYTGTKSQINPLLDTLRFIRYIFRVIFKG